MVSLQPLSTEEFPAFFEQAVVFYAAQNVAAGRFSESNALELARTETLKLLPDGIATSGQFFFAIVSSSEAQPVGHLWLASIPRGSSTIMFVYQVLVRPEHRRRGYARHALLAAEGVARNLGFYGIGLHVFAHNAEAQALYQALGYQVASINMLKPLDRSDA
jgi:ribosomal protein S18 acetylase RimI-like enzyme